MTRFKNSKNIDHMDGDKTLKLMTSGACDQDLMNNAGWALDDSIWLLKRADAAIGAKRTASSVVRYAHRYFLTDAKKIATDDLATIRRVVGMILTGLKSDVTLKIGDLGKGTLGSVKGRAKSENVKSYHNQVNVVRDTGPRMERKGAIHITDGVLARGRLGVVTLIHEASHKFAGTTDYSYFDNDSVTPESEFTSKAAALRNADSYAWFVLKIGRSWNPLCTATANMMTHHAGY